MKNPLILLFTLFLYSTILSQEQKKEDVVIQNFLIDNTNFHNQLKEKFFLDTDKQVYYSGEKVWFKAYVVKDVDNKPYNTTTNLYVNLKSPEGELIEKKMFFCEKGTSFGEIKLPKSLKSGKYFIEIETVWNRNFTKQNYQYQVDVINKDNELITSNEPNKKEELNIEFFPESGVLLKKRYNKVFFKINKGENPIEIVGEIVDDLTKEKMGNIKSDSSGRGVFDVYIREKQRKIIVLNFKGNQYKFPLPKASKKGFILNKVKEDTKSIFFRIKTNQETIEKNNKDTLFLVLERKGFAKSINPIILNKKYENYIINFHKETFFEGINSLYLFDNNKNILARKNVFISKGLKVKLNATLKQETKDSLYINLESLNYYKKLNTSVSVLPYKSKIINENNIKASFLTSPYINLYKDNFKYLKKEDELAINTISNTDLNKSLGGFNGGYAFEQGISLEGKVSNLIFKSNENKTDFEVVLSSKDNGIFLTTKLNSDNIFKFDHFKMDHPSEYQLYLLDDKGNMRPCSFHVFDNNDINKKENVFLKLKKEDKIIINNNIITYKEEAEDKIIINNNIVTYKEEAEDEILDEIVLSSIKRKEKEKKIVFPQFSDLNSANFKTEKILKSRLMSTNTIADVVHGIQGVNFINSAHKIVFTGRGVNTFLGDLSALVIFNGSVLTNHGLLKEIRASELDGKIRVSKSGAGYGVRGSKGVLVINTKKATSNKQNKKLPLYNHKEKFKNNVQKERFKKYTTSFGYAKASNTYINESLESEKITTKVIDWFPNFNINPNKPNILKIKKSGEKGVNLIINGFSEEGELLHEIIKIPYNLN